MDTSPRIPYLSQTALLTAQGLLDWYMKLLPLGLMWNPDDDPLTLINHVSERYFYTAEEAALLCKLRDKIHSTFLDPCEIALHAIGCYEAGTPAIAIAGMGSPRVKEMAAAATALAYVPAPLSLFYLRMYNDSRRRTAHCVCSRSSALIARIEVIRMLGDDWQCEETKTICTVSDLVCMQLN